MVSSLREQWQNRLDRSFPKGAIAGWDNRDPDSPVYQVPRIHVTGMRGLDPVVTFGVHGVDKGFQVIASSYTEVQQKPLVARLSLEGWRDPMLWSAGVSDQLAFDMRTERAGDTPGAVDPRDTAIQGVS